jgi:hypothetical protein
MGHNYSDRQIRKLRREHLKGAGPKSSSPAPLSHMPRDGITKVRVWCCNQTCNHSSMVTIDQVVQKLGPDATIVDLERKLWCAKCGGRKIAAQPSRPVVRGQGDWPAQT